MEKSIKERLEESIKKLRAWGNDNTDLLPDLKRHLDLVLSTAQETLPQETPKDEPATVLPEYLRPLVEQAKIYPLETFRQLLNQRASAEVQEARTRADARIAERRAFWDRLFLATINAGLTPEQANKQVRGTPAWEAMDTTTEAQIQRAEDLEAYWTKGLQQVKEAMKECVLLARQSGTIANFNIADLYQGLDKSEKTWYNDTMDEIRIPRFNVVIPANSNSLKIERALEPVTDELNSTPLVVNRQVWTANRETLEGEVDRLTKECHVAAGRIFRPNSSKDCAQLLFEEMGLPIQRVNKRSGAAAVDEDTLQALDAMGEAIAGKIMEARKAISKLSQMNAWEPYALAGKVQAQWNQLGTPHGRYSCEDPNLQSRIVEIRETIEAQEGWQLTSCDLGQGEYVTWASLSEDPILTAAFASGKDFHEQMYNEIHAAAPDVDLHEPDHRKSGKTLNFALLYLMQPFVVARQLGISQEDATKLIQAYCDRAPKAIDYRDHILADAQVTGRVSTKFGRIRYMPELRTAKGADLHQARKTAWHHHNAGTAAEILKIKQAKVWRALRKAGIDNTKARVALQMHDELIVMAKDEVMADVQAIMLAKFNEPVKGFLPFKIDQRTGKNWRQISK